VGVRHNNCPVIVDVGGGWGAAAVGTLERNGIPVVALVTGEPDEAAEASTSAQPLAA
jgi:hypothetical protein